MMKREMKLNKGIIIPAICLIVAILIPQVVTQKYILQVGTTLLFFACFSSAWNIIGGYAGQFALGNGLYIGVGAYAAGICYVGGFCSPWIGMILSAVIAGLLSMVLAYPCFKLSGTYYSLSTVALLHVFRIIFNQEDHIFGFYTGGAVGLKLKWVGGFWNMQFVDKIYYYFIFTINNVNIYCFY